jgi:O-antigen ligase
VSTAASAGRWLFLAGVMLMVTGDGPSATVGLSRWPTPLPFLAWEWLYLVLLSVGAACFLAGGGAQSWTLPHLRFVVVPLTALLGACALSAVASQVHTLSAIAMLVVAGVVVACWVFALFVDDERVNRALWPTLAIALALLAVRVIIWRREEGLNVVAFQILNNAWTGKIQLAWVFNIFAPLLLARTLSEPRRVVAVLYGIAWALTGVATYLLFSRMGSIVFAVTTLGVWIFSPAQWRRVVVIVVVGAAIATGLVARSDKMSRYVFSTIVEPDRNPGVDLRLGVWRESLRLFRSRPVTGVGLGTYDEVAYAVDGSIAEPSFRGNGWHAHNVYLHVLVETGIIGLLAWCYFWYAILARQLGAWKRAASPGRVTIAGTVWAVLAFLVLSISEVMIGARVHGSLRMNLVIGLMVVLGLHLTKPYSSAREHNE